MNWNQLKTVLVLRWQLTRNQWSRSKYGLQGAISFVIAVVACAMGAISFVGAFIGGAVGLKDASPTAIMLIWLFLVLAFVFFWTIGLLVELQRSETIDLQRLMHLPVRLRQIFVINYIASHFAFSLIIAVPAAIGLSVGLTIARGPMMLLLVPLSLSMVFMITAWTYCLRGWLATLMNNPRRKRSVIVFLTLVFVLFSQGPNLYFNVFGGRSTNARILRGKLQTVESWQKFIPPLWVSLGARSLAANDPWPASFGTLGCAVIGAIGLRRAYRSTLSYYYSNNHEHIQPAAAGLSRKSGRAGRNLLEIRLPGLADEASAVALGSLRAMLRAPEVKMAWFMSFLVTVIVGASVLFRTSSRIPETFKPFVALSATMFSFFVLFQQLGNLFGFDRDGFGTFVMSPANRAMILLGKNIAIFPVIMSSGFLLLVLVTFWLHLPVLTAIAGLFQIATMATVACMFGNLLSILVPYRIQPASLKPTKIPPGTAVLMILCQFLFPVALLPIVAAPLLDLACRSAGMPAAVPLNLLLSMVLLVLVGIVYRMLLAPMGQLLQRRETKILQTVTAQVE
ncbi:MAG: hypothetical protein ACJ8M1_13960 [Chthoniobacterales bacterium]